MHANVHMRKHTQYTYTVNLIVLEHSYARHVIKETKKQHIIKNQELNNTLQSYLVLAQWWTSVFHCPILVMLIPV